REKPEEMPGASSVDRPPPMARLRPLSTDPNQLEAAWTQRIRRSKKGTLGVGSSPDLSSRIASTYRWCESVLRSRNIVAERIHRPLAERLRPSFRVSRRSRCYTHPLVGARIIAPARREPETPVAAIPLDAGVHAHVQGRRCPTTAGGARSGANREQRRLAHRRGRCQGRDA